MGWLDLNTHIFRNEGEWRSLIQHVAVDPGGEGMDQCKLTIGAEEQKTLRLINYNQTRLQLVKDVLYEAAMIEKLTDYIPEKYAESIYPHLKAVRRSKNVTELVTASTELQKAFEVIRKRLGPLFSPKLEVAIRPIRKQERRNLNTLWLALGQAEGLRLLSDLVDAYTWIDSQIERNPDTKMQTKITVREIGSRFFGPADASGKAQAFNHLLVHQLFGTVVVYQDGSLNNAHYVEITDDGLQWYLGILAHALLLSKGFDDGNHGYFNRIRGFLEIFVGARRAIMSSVAAIVATFAFAPDAYAFETANASIARVSSYTDIVKGLTSENLIEVDQFGTTKLAEGSGTHRFGGGTVPLLLAEGSGAHRFGEGTVPLILAAFTDPPREIFTDAAVTTDFVSGVTGWSEEAAIHAGYEVANKGASVTAGLIVAEWAGRATDSPKMAINEWFTEVEMAKVHDPEATVKVTYSAFIEASKIGAGLQMDDVADVWKVAASY